MKIPNATRLLALALFGLLGFCNISYGQSTNSSLSRPDSPKAIKIEGNARIQDNYSATITELGFTTAEQARRFFNRISDNLIAYTVDANTNQVTMHLYLNRAPKTWTATDWNTYINNKINSL